MTYLFILKLWSSNRWHFGHFQPFGHFGHVGHFGHLGHFGHYGHFGHFISFWALWHAFVAHVLVNDAVYSCCPSFPEPAEAGFEPMI